MRNIVYQMQKAREQAKAHGHNLGKFRKHPTQAGVWVARCAICTSPAWVSDEPWPDGSRTHGHILESACLGSPTQEPTP